MFASWKSIATVGGAGALTYLAASPAQSVDGVPSYRLCLGQSKNLTMDVRFLGGLAMGLGSMWKNLKEPTRDWLGTGAVASFASLASTEAIRWQQERATGIKLPGGYAPSFSGMLGTTDGSRAAPAYQHARSSSWAAR